VTLSPAILEILILRELQRSTSVTACFSGIPALSRKTLFLRKKSPPLSVDVMEAELGMDFFNRRKLILLVTFAGRHAALASVGEKELAAGRFERSVRRLGSGSGGGFGANVVGLVRRESGAIQVRRVQDGTRRRNSGVGDRFLYRIHARCYHRSKLRSMLLFT
jgi:hypothetical protein